MVLTVCSALAFAASVVVFAIAQLTAPGSAVATFFAVCGGILLAVLPVAMAWDVALSFDGLLKLFRRDR